MRRRTTGHRRGGRAVDKNVGNIFGRPQAARRARTGMVRVYALVLKTSKGNPHAAVVREPGSGAD